MASCLAETIQLSVRAFPHSEGLAAFIARLWRNDRQSVGMLVASVCVGALWCANRKEKSMSETILAVGAAGRNAGLVVRALAGRGARVRALIRKTQQADAVRRAGADEVAVGDLTDRASIDAALRNVTRLFYIAPAFINGEAELGLAMLEAARAA